MVGLSWAAAAGAQWCMGAHSKLAHGWWCMRAGDVAAARTVVVDSCVPGHYSWDTELRVFAELPGICGQLRLQEEHPAPWLTSPTMSCSANPTLAAIQRAKSQRADAGDVGSRKSLDHVGVRKSVDLVATARAPAPSSPAAKAVITEAGGHNSEGVKNVFGAVDGHSDKGWWAHTDAGQMNAEDELVKTGQSKAPQAPSLDAALGPKKGLDFSALFAERGAEPMPPEQQASQPGPHHGGTTVKLQGGPWKDDEGKAAGWWTKMDAGDLNKVEELVKGGAAAYTPQFVGSSGLTSKLDYSAAHCVSTEPQQQ
ncbi:hypothetical protein HaLaN_04528 [Haematococcus lacustris]|uniref:Uncharacterized protein n=1 Tax=Haematococcus lacustris TaxID=44745 RepID=A0A699YIT7_HAELA|nr:hypothetical protein HaLaN_04528 [Haematococcus lacustris]